MKNVSGLTLVEETEGTGPAASKGDRVIYNLRLFLNKGDEVEINEVENREKWPSETLSEVDGTLFINFTSTLGKREAVTAVEYALYGMKVGGYRMIRASPHIAYREQGIPGKVPGNAVVTFRIWLRQLNLGSSAQGT